MVVARGGGQGVGSLGVIGEGSQTSNPKINKSWGCTVQLGDYSQ